ncbi:transcription factor bHLH [Forsythia ovata]|uniref:Transcription factor bHLH n=1 Tax=Forsythia ovata TaxID=205694 RepID=A0ABD1S2N8_9LAMI
MPKNEQQLFNVNSVSNEVPQYNFFSKTTSSVAESDVIYPRLLGLLYFELPQYNHFQLSDESSSSLSKNPVEPASITVDLKRKSYHLHRFGPYRSSEAVAPSSTMARLRWQRISDKTRCLQKFLPWDKRMDMTTMLEETYKYIKFLQAQISVLQSMLHTAGNDENDGVYDG